MAKQDLNFLGIKVANFCQEVLNLQFLIRGCLLYFFYSQKFEWKRWFITLIIIPFTLLSLNLILLQFFVKFFIQKFLSFYIYTILGYVFMHPFLGKGIAYASLLCKTMRSCMTLCHHFLQKGFVAVKMKVISCLHCLRFLDLRAQPLDDQSHLLIQEFSWGRCDLNLLAVNVNVIQRGRNIYNITSNLNIRAIFQDRGSRVWG